MSGSFLCKSCSLEYPLETKASYCKNCGFPLKNFCLDKTCKYPVQVDALFCEECGSKTSYNKFEIVKDEPF